METDLQQIAALLGIGMVPVILERVFSFIKWQSERQDRGAATARDERLVSLMERQTRVLEDMIPLIRSIHMTAKTYENHVCPLTDPDGRDSVVEAVANAVKGRGQ